MSRSRRQELLMIAPLWTARPYRPPSAGHIDSHITSGMYFFYNITATPGVTIPVRGELPVAATGDIGNRDATPLAAGNLVRGVNVDAVTPGPLVGNPLAPPGVSRRLMMRGGGHEPGYD